MARSRRQRRNRRRAVKTAVVAAASVVATAVGLAALTGGEGGSAGNSVSRKAVGGSGAQPAAPVPAAPAGDSAGVPAALADGVQSFSVTTIDGGRFVSPPGKPAVVFFLASEGCESCRAEAVALDSGTRTLGDGVALLGVEMAPGTPESALRDFRESLELHYPLAQDPDGELVQRFAVKALATTVVLDASGRVTFWGVAPDAATLRRALADSGSSSEAAPRDG